MTVASAGTSAPLVVNGLVSGITTPKVIQALLAGYQAPITSLTEHQAVLEEEAGYYRALATDFQGVLTAAQALSTAARWDLASASSSDPTVATAVASPGAETGSLTFGVSQLAQANVLASEKGVASTGQVVTTQPSLLVSTGAPAVGFSSLAPGASLALGAYTITVTQSSGAAMVTGTSALASSTTIGSTNDTLSLGVGGVVHTLVITSGTYSPSGLATALDAAAAAAGVALSASVGPTGQLELTTAEQGSAAALSVSGGSSLGALGLVAGEAGIGADAVVTVDGSKTTLTSITAGQVVTLAAPGTATLSATVSLVTGPTGALVSAGTAHAALVSTGSGSLAQVVAAINGSGLAVTASAVTLQSGTDILQVAASSTGVAGSVGIDPAAFTGSALGSLRTLVTARTATVSVGGTGGYTLRSATDTFTGLLAGTSVTVASTGSTTVTVAPDATAEASKVASLVTAVDKALADIQKYAGYTAASKTGGPLMGAAVVTDIQQQILSIFSSAAGTSSLGDLSNAGVTLTKTGTVDFTRQAFLAAFTKSPAQVTALFTQGATFAPASGQSAGEVGLLAAGTDTAPGAYVVTVSHSATQAIDTGATRATGTVSVAETLTVSMGTATATYSTAAGEPLSAVAAGLNSAFAGAGLSLGASVVKGTELEIASGAYGSQAAFSVTSSASGTGTTGLGAPTAGVAKAVQGTNVAGSVGGVAATGDGQVLTAPVGSPLDGLEVLVTAQGITTTTALGTLTYTPGAAQRLATAMSGATDPATGSVTGAVKSLTAEATGLTSQIDMYQRLEQVQRNVLEQELVTMETNLGSLKNESAMLSSQLSGLPTL